MEIYIGTATGKIGPLFSLTARTIESLNHLVGDRLSELTMDEGVELPDATILKIYKAKKFLGFVSKKVLIDERVIN